ncbi:DUF928 domain-containing protein [Oxynema sp. CENA135]|uniref:DUF928 domain-containing protein n=1 Tax=Oxynema sp. CENA135 TaxID=984206 RepID=UPI001A5E2FB1|nr:DUF928 domain-containing protein [Oxynema sp. CENA135]MBK4729114.1 DUF928 domain-containing protein [Oxynema sp. CENA135]
MLVGIGLSIAPIATAPVLARPLAVELDGFTVLGFFEPPGEGEPEQTEGAGTRPASVGLCPGDRPTENASLTPLVPHRDQALSARERPTFFVYIPETSARQAVFTLRDEGESYYYEQSIAIEGTPGVIEIPLPADAPELVADRDYTWFLSVACDRALRPGDPMVSGHVKRVVADPSLSNPWSETSTSVPQDATARHAQLTPYLQNHLWYDALAIVAQWRQAPATDNQDRIWEQLLESVGLEKIAREPGIPVNTRSSPR